VLEPPPDVQLTDAAAFLSDRFGIGPDEVEYVGEGAWTRCFGFILAGSDLVVRFGRHIEDFQRDRTAARFAGRNLPIPQVIEIDEAFGVWYCISTRASGTPLEELESKEWDHTLPSVLATLDALRTADISATSGYGAWGPAANAPYGSWSDFLAAIADDQPGSRTHGWKQRLADSPQGVATFDRAHAQMLELAHSFPGPRSLVHNDLLNRNALATAGQITSVFDWGCSIYGDFVYELATFVFWSPWHAAIDRTDMATMALDHYGDMGLEVPNFEDRLRCGALHIGLQHLAYNAFLGDLDTLQLTDDRTVEFLDGLPSS
jgi:hygromycin-B 4-O-kinase